MFTDKNSSQPRASSAPELRPIIISGPSGVGKGTLMQMLIDAHPGKFSATVSHTTCKPRPGEKEGIAYHFVSPAIFSEMVAKDCFIEHTFFSGNHYGTSKDTIAHQRRAGSTPLLDIDVEGVKAIVESGGFDAQCVFIRPPRFKSLEDRLRGRGTETEANIQKRLARARLELQYAETSRVYDIVIINDNIGKAYKELEAFAFEGHSRPG